MADATHPGLAGLLAGRGLSGTEAAVFPGGLIVPAEPAVSLVVDLTGGASRGFVVTAGRRYHSAAPAVCGPRRWATITLTLPGAYRLLGAGFGELDAPVHGLGDLLGVEGAEFAERIAEASDWRRRFARMQAFLAVRAASGSDPAAGVVLAWRRLVDSSGRLPTGTIADEVGWSRQRLVRMFRRCFGQPPKTLARMVRLRAALSRARAQGRWQQAAADAGYFDESHFGRDLREFTGTTPGR